MACGALGRRDEHRRQCSITRSDEGCDGRRLRRVAGGRRRRVRVDVVDLVDGETETGTGTPLNPPTLERPRSQCCSHCTESAVAVFRRGGHLNMGGGGGYGGVGERLRGGSGGVTGGVGEGSRGG